MVRILLCGDVRGRLGLLCEQIAKLHARLEPRQRFEAVFCVGEFTSEDMDLEPKPPIPVYFIDSGPAAQDLIEASPQGEEVSPNLHFLGHYGVATVAGVKVAFLSGRRHADLFSTEGEGAAAEDDEAAAAEGAQASSSGGLLDKYGAQGPTDGIALLSLRPEGGGLPKTPGAGPSWEDLKAKEQKAVALKAQLFVEGQYTPLAIERLKEEMADSGGVDLLLTAEWPAGVLRGVPRAWPEELENRKMVKTALKNCAAAPVGDLASAAEPKYHAVGLGGVFWRRPPWKHERRGEVVQSTGELRCGVCRMIALGAADGSRPGVVEAPASGSGAGGASTRAAPSTAAAPSSVAAGEEGAKPKPAAQKWLHGLDLDPNSLPAVADGATPSPWSEKAAFGAAAGAPDAASGGAAGESAPLRPEFNTEDKEERRRWMQRFGCIPEEMQRLSDKIAKESQPKEKKEKHKSLYKVSEKEKKRRKTGGDGHLPFAAKERMQAKG